MGERDILENIRDLDDSQMWIHIVNVWGYIYAWHRHPLEIGDFRINKYFLAILE